MDTKLREKLDAAITRFRQSYPEFTGGEGVAQTRARMQRAEAALPAIRKTFSDEEIVQLQKRLKEFDPGQIPTAHRANSNESVESVPYNFSYEYYFLSKLLKILTS